MADSPSQSVQEVAELSQVNPDKRLKKLKDKGSVLIITVMGLGLLAFASSGPSANPKIRLNEAAETSLEADTTLTKNLALLEAMKKLPLAVKEPQPGAGTMVNELREEVLPEKNELSKETLARMNAPTTLINNEQAPLQSMSADEKTNDPSSLLPTNSADSQYLNHQGEIPTVTAHPMAHPEWTIPAGEMIPATLGVAMNSELPGLIVASVARDVYSLTGEHVLAPRGSRLVGQYNAQIVQGQQRFLVVWNRLQLPNGVVVSINSSGTDNLGRAGLQADAINRHFLARFGSSSLLSIIGAFAANQGVEKNTPYNSAAEYRSAVSASFSQAAQQTFEHDRLIKPTLDKFQGADISVFVANDLDFSATAHLSMPQVQRVSPIAWK